MVNGNSTTYAAIGIINRLERDLAELTKAAAAAGTLPTDQDEQLFDAACHLPGAQASIQKAITNIRAYAGQRLPAPALTPDRAVRLQAAAAAAAEFNSAIFGD